MNKYNLSFMVSILILTIANVQAGNPDRQGEAGAYELLINPWAKGAGMNSLNGSYAIGVEAMAVNIAGLSRASKTEVALGHTRWLVPSGVSMNALGIAKHVGKNGTLGIALMAVKFGDIKVTTTDAPEGTGATYSPNYFNIGLGYSHRFGKKVSVGFLVRGVSESIQSLSAFGVAFDAGVQYVGGTKDNFKLGISLRNIGGPMEFRGQGLSTQLASSSGSQLTYNVRLTKFELPSLLHMGVSYDFEVGDDLSLTPVVNFTSNSFGRDEIGAGLELKITKAFGLRASYKYDIGKSTTVGKSAYTGLGLGASVNIPLDKKGNTMLGLDYAYRTTKPFEGTHNVGLSLLF